MYVPQQLYLPATDQELRDFSCRMFTVSDRLSGNMLDPHIVELDTKIYHGDGSLGRIHFYHELDGDGDSVDISLSQLVRIDNTWDPAVAESLLGDEYTGLNRFYQEAKEEGSVVVIGNEELGYEIPEDDGGIVEGYLEHETKLQIVREGRLAIDGMKTVSMNVLTHDLVVVDSIIGNFRAISGNDEYQEIQDLERLLQRDERVLDTTLEESLLNLPTPADLIMFTNALINMGLLGKRTIAFRGAKPYMHIPVLPLLEKQWKPSTGEEDDMMDTDENSD